MGIEGRTERRRHPRITFGEPIRVKVNGNKKKEFLSRDLSLNGLSFYPDGPLDLSDKKIYVSLSPPHRFVDDIFDSKCKLTGRIVGERRDSNGLDRYIAVEFDKNLRHIIKKIYKSRITKTLFLIPVVLSGIFLLKSLNIKYYWYHPVINIYSLTVTGYILSRFFIAFFYRPPKTTDYQPAVTFVIPVKDDEGIIAETIRRCFSVSYPKEKVEVIVVNDGSTDNTLKQIQSVKEAHPELTVIDFNEHKGKRYAMAAGTKQGTGEIIIYVDSDSLIEKDSLYYLVQGFADPSVGAISGHTYVLNTEESLLTRMEEVRYFVAFRVMKAAEHVFSSVSCCPGSLSAYRQKYVMEILDKWLNQTFLGNSVTFGDDRSLTNFMLRKYRVLYDCRAGAKTMVPSTWKKFFRQQLRWKKSWFRESLIAGRFMWYKHPLASISYYLGIIFPLISPSIIFNAFIYKPLFFRHAPIYYSLGFGLISLLYSIYYLLKRPNTKWLYGFHFCLLYMAVLSWQTYYAVLTCRRNHWGTR